MSSRRPTATIASGPPLPITSETLPVVQIDRQTDRVSQVVEAHSLSKHSVSHIDSGRSRDATRQLLSTEDWMMVAVVAVCAH
jgi:hypothetical protein